VNIEIRRYVVKTMGLCVAVCLTLVMMSCGGPMLEVSQKFEKRADFAGYKTYAWMEGQSTSDMRISSSADVDLDGSIRDAVNKQMVEKGFAEVDENPDVLLKYHVGYRSTAYTTSFGMHYHEKVGWSETETVTDGQLTIDFVDSKTEMVVWRGTAWGALNVDPNQTIVNKNVNRAVGEIFKQYPPDVSKAAPSGS
jgi:hypothetical protein